MDEKMLKEMEKIKVTATAQELWEPAKPGETLENVWIPNRRERRRMLHAKGRKRGMRAIGKALQAAEQSAKENPEIRQDIYKALYENLKKMTENIEEDLAKKNEEEAKENEENGTNEGN
jgi:type IV secretory pathway VirB4 component